MSGTNTRIGILKTRKSHFLFGAASAALGLALIAPSASAASLDEVMQRLEALEKSNAKLARENAVLRSQVRDIQQTRQVAGPSAPAASGAKGNPVGHGAVAASPEAAPAPAAAGGKSPIITKAGPLGPIIDNTTVTLYGHIDASVDLFDVGVFDQGTKVGIASNSSYFGVRVRHNLTPYGYAGWAFLGQYEELVEVAATPTERAAFGSRDSFVGVEGPYGSVKIGKGDTPYKRSTAAFDPFANTVGDYNSIMGNTGGDNRAEFDWRMPHAIWYESPIINGFQFSALASPGQNFAPDNSDFAYGEFNCTGSTPRGSGSGFPSGSPIGVGACNDGNFGTAYSAALTYKNGPLTLIAAGELHEGVNRVGDETGGVGPNANQLLDGSVIVTGIHNEWGAKVGGGYRVTDPLGPLQFYGIYEWLRRENAVAAFNERSRDAAFASATQFIGPHWSVSASYAHAFKSPGNPALLSPNDTTALPVPAGTAALYQANLFSNDASMYSLGTRYRFNEWASWYAVGTLMTQGAGAHYCLGASGHGYQLCSRDGNNDTIGGATIKAVSTGLTFDF